MARIKFKNWKLKEQFVLWCHQKGFSNIGRMASGKVKNRQIPLKDLQWEYRNNYLKSEHWFNLRSEKLAETPCCEVCGTSENLTVHHKRYKNLYNVKLDDLSVLCWSHHSMRHSTDIKAAYEAFCLERRDFIESFPTEDRGYYSERKPKYDRVAALGKLKDKLLRKIDRAWDGDLKAKSWLSSKMDKIRNKRNAPKPRKWSGFAVVRY